MVVGGEGGMISTVNYTLLDSAAKNTCRAKQMNILNFESGTQIVHGGLISTLLGCFLCRFFYEV